MHGERKEERKRKEECGKKEIKNQKEDPEKCQW